MTEFTFEKYPFLKELGLKVDNPGVYAGGKWFGSGPQQVCLNPATEEQIARVRTATEQEYEEAV